MITVNVDTDIVGTKFNKTKQTCLYTVERNGKRWTAEIPLDELQRLGGNKMARRKIVENYLATKMAGPPDDEKI